MSLNMTDLVSECVADFKPLLDQLSMDVKFQMYRILYRDRDKPESTEAMLNLLVALTSDKDIQAYLNMMLTNGINL